MSMKRCIEMGAAFIMINVALLPICVLHELNVY